MENLTKQHAVESHLAKGPQRKSVSKRTLVMIGITIAILGVLGSFFFANKTEKFFWNARTELVTDVAHEQGKHTLQKNDIENWQDAEVIGRMELLAKETREYIPNVVAIKIFTTDGTLAWTNLKNVKAGYKKPGIETELGEIKNTGHLVKEAGNAVKEELKTAELLEIWTILETMDGETIGFIELYFDSSDISVFVNDIKYSIWGTLALMLGITLFLISLAFRAQDKKILEQSEYLNGIINESPIGIYTINTNGFIESYNPAMMKISGIKDANEIIGKNVFDAVAYQKNGLDKLLMSGVNGVAFETEVEVESSLGEHNNTFRHYYGVPLKNVSGEIEHLLIMVEDITNKKRLEKQVTERAGDLEAKINERTKALQDKLEELERFQRLTVDRELRMTELKQEIEKMRVRLESLGANPNA